jgi:hypothetical protein
VAEGQGSTGGTVIPFAPVDARFVRITQTTTTGQAPVWTIQRLRLFSE